MAFIMASMASMILATVASAPGPTIEQDEPARRGTPRAPQQPIELPGVPDWLADHEFDRESFTFVRIQYDPVGRRGRQRYRGPPTARTPN